MLLILYAYLGLCVHVLGSCFLTKLAKESVQRVYEVRMSVFNSAYSGELSGNHVHYRFIKM